MDCVKIERKNPYRGLLDNFVIEGFRFDKFIHLSFTKSEDVRQIFDKTLYHTHNPLSYNHYKSFLVKASSSKQYLSIAGWGKTENN